MRVRFLPGAHFILLGAGSMRYWLMKSEPDEVSFDDVLAASGQTVAWFGVRNYQAQDMCPYKNGQFATPV